MNGQNNSDMEETLLPRAKSLKISSTLSLVPQLLTSVSNGQGNPPPTSNASKDRALANSTLNPPSTLPTSPDIGAPAPTRHAGPFTTIKRIAFLFILLLLLAATVLGTLFVLTRSNTKTAASINPIVGHAFFISSGQISEHSNQGINDELLIELQNIPDPAPGNSYYAWLLGDAAQVLAPPILLGKLPVSNGQVHYLYKGDSHHSNLMAITSRFLITEENASTPPSNPSPDKSTWRYSAQLPQTPDSMDMMHEGALQHLRHMLADAPELMQVNLPGGLDIWLFRNTQKVAEWAGGARDFWENKSAAGVHNHVIRILDYLDGEVYVQQDVPTGTPNLVNPRIAPVALLEFDQQKQSPPGLLYLVGIHLSALVQAPGISHENQLLAAQIDQESNNVQTLLQQVRKDAKLLVAMNNTQLLSNSSLALLDDMETAANSADILSLYQNTNTVQGGVVHLHYTLEHLAADAITHV